MSFLRGRGKRVAAERVAPRRRWTQSEAPRPERFPETPMTADLSSQAPVPDGAGENLQYTPPTGSTITGGTLSAQLYADGYNTYGRAVATVNEPGDSISSGDGSGRRK